MTYLPTTPQGIGPLLDSGFRLYAASLKHVFLLAGLGSLAGALPGLWFNWQLPAQPTVPEAVFDLLVPMGAMTLLSIVVSLLIYAMVVVRMQTIGVGERADLGGEFRRGLKALPWLVLGSILYFLAVTIGLVLLIVPGLILSVSLIFYSYGILFDGAGPVSGLKQSHRLVKGHWWRTVLILSVALILMLVVYFALSLALGFSVGFALVESQAAWLLIDLLVQMVVGSMVAPLVYAIALAQYQDLKLRRQGTDLEARIEGRAVHSSGVRA